MTPMQTEYIRLTKWELTPDGRMSHDFAFEGIHARNWAPSGDVLVTTVSGTRPPLTNTLKLVIEFPDGKPDDARITRLIVWHIATALGYKYDLDVGSKYA